MWDENSISLRIESVYVYTKDINGELVNKFNNQSFTKGSAVLEREYCNPKSCYSFNIFLLNSEKRKLKLMVCGIVIL